LDFAELAAAEGIELHPMFAANRQSVHFALGSTFLFDEMPTFRDTLTLPSPEREQCLRDPGRRERMRAELADPRGRSFVFTWDTLRVESVARAEHERFVDRTVQDIADELGGDPRDAFPHGPLADGLETQFRSATPPSPARRAAVETMMRSDVTMAGSSDGGAHVLSFCGADFTTRLLTEWVPDVLGFEAAVARLTSVPARAYGIQH